MKMIDYIVKDRGFDELFKTASFEEKDDAAEKIREIEDSLYSSPYYLNHGELGRPTFKAQRYKDGWGIKVLWNYIPGTCHAPRDGRFTSKDRFFNLFFD